MRYSNFWQIIAMTIVWAVVLMAIDKAAHRPTDHMMPKTLSTPQVNLFVQHVGCNGRDKDIVQVFTSMPWLAPAQVLIGEQMAETHKPHEELRPEEKCAALIRANVTNLEQVDFVALLQALRDIHIIPGALEFGGVKDFDLVVQLGDLSCLSCVRGAEEALTPLKVSAAYYFSTSGTEVNPNKVTTFTWMKSRSVDKQKNTATATVRTNHIARVWEMIRALENAGLPPLAVRVMVKAT